MGKAPIEKTIAKKKKRAGAGERQGHTKATPPPFPKASVRVLFLRSESPERATTNLPKNK